MHFLSASAQLPESNCCEMDATRVWAQVEHFCYKLELNIFAINLIALKLFCMFCYFLQQKVCRIVFSNYCNPNYWDFCAAYTELYLLLASSYAKPKMQKSALRISIDCL